MTVFALLGAAALWLLYAWLLMAVIASYLSERKGYTEKPGLACGLLLHIVGVVIWLVWPAKPNSKWKTAGIAGRVRSAGRRRDEAAREA
jgi:fucose permease